MFLRAWATAPAVVAAGLNWLVEQDCQLVNMSFGLRQDRRVLREACLAARRAGAVLVAAAPARGPAVFPSAYDGVVRVTGDARCAPGEFSRLGTAQADFGACVRGAQAGDRPCGGASFAVARVTAALAAHLGAGGDARDVAAYLRGIARYQGPERKRGAVRG